MATSDQVTRERSGGRAKGAEKSNGQDTRAIDPRRMTTVDDEVSRMRESISRRAYELFERRGDASTGSLSDWLAAEHELLWQPPLELRQRGDHFEVQAAVPGIDARDLDVRVTPEDVLIQADIEHHHEPEDGTVHMCEFSHGRLFRSVHFPERIDPESVTADYRDGVLRLRARIAPADGAHRRPAEDRGSDRSAS